MDTLAQTESRPLNPWKILAFGAFLMSATGLNLSMGAPWPEAAIFLFVGCVLLALATCVDAVLATLRSHAAMTALRQAVYGLFFMLTIAVMSAPGILRNLAWDMGGFLAVVLYGVVALSMASVIKATLSLLRAEGDQ
jgi:hypothetical protein